MTESAVTTSSSKEGCGSGAGIGSVNVGRLSTGAGVFEALVSTGALGGCVVVLLPVGHVRSRAGASLARALLVLEF